jgi:DNA repair exonuclease SbcCD nuclease subunit
MVASKQMPLQLENKQLIIIHDNVIVEKFDKHGISMLFIPDELPFDNLFETAHELITAASLDKVDIVVHHGYCQHLLPSNLPHTPPNVYSAKEYAQLAHGPVLNGHVHKPGVYRQIVSGGSFERLAHAEEEDKGFFIVEYNPDNHHTSYNFIKNSGAIKFLTIDLPPTVTIPVALTMLQDVAELLVGEILAYVRIKTDDPILRHAAKEMMKKYQNIVFSYDSISRSKQQIDVVENEDLKCVLQPMTPDNLPGIISKFLATSGITLTTEVIKTELAEL